MFDPEQLEHRRQVAIWRHGVIAPMLMGTFTEGSLNAYARRLEKQGLNRPDGSNGYYSAKTILGWKRRYEKEGIEGLMPKPRSDKGQPRALSDEAQKAILCMHKNHPRMSAVQMHKDLITEGVIPVGVSRSTVQRFLRKTRIAEQCSPDAEVKERKAFEAEYPNILWQGDTAFMPQIPVDGKMRRTYMMVLIDDHSRMIVGARIFTRDNALNFQNLLQDAVRTYGIPTKLFLDNGAPYSNDQLRFICASIGSVLINTKPRDPQAKGKIERVIKTCEDQFLGCLDIDEVKDLDDFNRRLQEWVRTYNNTVHSTTKMTPRNRFLSGTQKRAIRRIQSPEWLADCFRNRIVRKVRSDSTVTISGVSYDVPMQFVGRKVEIWYLPSDPEDAFIPFDDERFVIRPTDRVANGKAKRRTGKAARAGHAMEEPVNDE